MLERAGRQWNSSRAATGAKVLLCAAKLLDDVQERNSPEKFQFCHGMEIPPSAIYCMQFAEIRRVRRFAELHSEEPTTNRANHCDNDDGWWWWWWWCVSVRLSRWRIMVKCGTSTCRHREDDSRTSVHGMEKSWSGNDSPIEAVSLNSNRMERGAIFYFLFARV